MILIIAYGNELRQDDAAGLHLAEKLERAWQARGCAVRRIAVQQLTPEIAVEAAAPAVDAVVFVDARLTAAPGSPAQVEVAALAARVASAVVGHHVDPAVVQAYAGVLTAEPLPPFWLVTAPGVAFDHGQGLSRSAQEAIDCALDDKHSELSRLIASYVV